MLAPGVLVIVSYGALERPWLYVEELGLLKIHESQNGGKFQKGEGRDGKVVLERLERKLPNGERYCYWCGKKGRMVKKYFSGRLSRM